jgi:Malate:quinone oxidoreductase (Mqo)
MNGPSSGNPDIVLVGAGIMSATLAVFLKELDPSLSIEIFETLDGAGLESSDAWNNAGTGHAALCELNYTPERPDGSIDISKALEVNTEFDLSRQLWTYLIRKKAIASPDLFIHAVPHMSFVHGKAHVDFLKKRHAALTAHHLYRGMDYTEDPRTLSEWVPIVMEGRVVNQDVAATRRRRCQLRRAHPQPHHLSANTERLCHSLFAPHHASASRCGRLAHRGARRDERPLGIDASQIRLSRRRRRRAAAAAEIGNSGSLRLCRISRERHLAALRRP